MVKLTPNKLLYFCFYKNCLRVSWIRAKISLLSIIYKNKLRNQGLKGHSILLFSLAFFQLSMTIIRRVKIWQKEQTYIPLRFFSVCLFVTFFLPPTFFLCLSACKIFSTPYVFLPPKYFSVYLSVTFFLCMSVTFVYLICFHSPSQFIYRYL